MLDFFMNEWYLAGQIESEKGWEDLAFQFPGVHKK